VQLLVASYALTLPVDTFWPVFYSRFSLIPKDQLTSKTPVEFSSKYHTSNFPSPPKDPFVKKKSKILVLNVVTSFLLGCLKSHVMGFFFFYLSRLFFFQFKTYGFALCGSFYENVCVLWAFSLS